MADWPRIIRNRPLVSLLAVSTASLVSFSVVRLWGPVAWVAAATLASTCFALYAWHRRVSEAHARAAADGFSFREWVVRMREKDRARVLIDTQRREQIAGTR